MDKTTPIVFKKYGQLYEGTFQSGDGNKVKVASLSGGIHTIDAKDMQTKEAYFETLKATKKDEV